MRQPPQRIQGQPENCDNVIEYLTECVTGKRLSVVTIPLMKIIVDQGGVDDV